MCTIALSVGIQGPVAGVIVGPAVLAGIVLAVPGRGWYSLADVQGNDWLPTTSTDTVMSRPGVFPTGPAFAGPS